MPIVFKQKIVRSDLRNNPAKRFVFDDNVQRRGFAGQAKDMRGEKNAIGVVTKWAPSMDPKATVSECRRTMAPVRDFGADAAGASRFALIPPSLYPHPAVTV